MYSGNITFANYLKGVYPYAFKAFAEWLSTKISKEQYNNFLNLPNPFTIYYFLKFCDYNKWKFIDEVIVLDSLDNKNKDSISILFILAEIEFSRINQNLK